MSAIPEVPDPVEMASGENRRAAQRLLAEVLAAARRGDLEDGWREVRSAAALTALQRWRPGPATPPEIRPLDLTDFDPAQPLAPLAEFFDWWEGSSGRQNALLSEYFTILDVATGCPVGAWEPGSGASAREALDSWYRAAVQCAAEELAEIPELPQGSDERSQRIALGAGRLWTRWRAENGQRVDLLAESYEAGLVSAGAGDGGWVDRSRARVAKWPEILGFSRNEHLWMLDDPLYQASQELLPPYWSTAT